MGSSKEKVCEIKEKKVFKPIGKYLAKSRKRAGLTQQAVADQLGLQSAQYISNVERGLSSASSELSRTAIEMYGINRAEYTRLLAGCYHDYFKSILR